MNELYSYAFYNVMINPLAEIEESYQAGDYQSVLSGLRTLYRQLQESNWTPFPHYQSIKSRLKILEKVSVLGLMVDGLDKSTDNDVKVTYQALIPQIFPVLKAYAHLFSFLSVTHKDPAAVKASIIQNAMKQLRPDLFNAPVQAYGCDGRKQFINREQYEARLAAQDSLSRPEYLEIMQLFNQFKDEKLETFCQTLFQTMSEIDRSDMTPISSNANLFTVGAIHTVVDESNKYKNKFNQLIEELKNPQENQENNNTDTTVCDFVTDAIDRMQLNK